MSVPLTVRPPATDVEPVQQGRLWRAGAALCRVESLRLLRHPAVLTGIAAYLIPWIYTLVTQGESGRFPVLQDSDRGTQIRLLPLALGTLLGANLAMLRPAQHGAEALRDVLVLPVRYRVAALLAAVVPTGLVAALLAGARIVVLAAQPGAAGRPNLLELAGGPAMVVLFGALGVLLGRLTRSSAAAPLALVTLAVLVLAAMLPGRLAESSGRWLLPLTATQEGSPPLPRDLLGRPAGWHLAYLAGLTVLVVAAALASSRFQVRAWGPLAAAGLALALLAGGLQLRSPSATLTAARTAATYEPADQQTCERRGPLTYCAFPDFTGQVDGWDGTVRAVLRRTPPQVAGEPRVIRQRVEADRGLKSAGIGRQLPLDQWRADDRRQGGPSSIPVGTSWNNNTTVIELAGQVAFRVVTGADAPADGLRTCEARGALVLWLAGQAGTRSRSGLDSLITGSSGGVTLPVAGFGSGYYFTQQAVVLAQRMAARPADDMAARVLRSWPELTAAGTSYERAGQLLGVEVPPADGDGVCP